jgi:predicted GNAT family N-acyltransferase
MAVLSLIPHAELTSQQLDEIIRIKSIAWPYPYEKQCKWIFENIKNFDIHVLLLDQQKQLKAYLNLIDIVIRLDNKDVQAFGIGNVCSSEKGKGWGKELILRTNDYLKEKQRLGILFCKRDLVQFYKKNGWKLVAPDKLEMLQGKDVQTMVYNVVYQRFDKLEYHGKKI